MEDEVDVMNDEEGVGVIVVVTEKAEEDGVDVEASSLSTELPKPIA